MSLVTPFVLAGIAAASEYGGYQSSKSAASSQENSLNLESKQQQLQYQQKTIANMDTVSKVLDAQTAQATTRGYALNSGSFNAIQRDSLNTASKNQSNLNIENSLAQENINIEKQNVKDALRAKLLSFGVQAASTAVMAYTSMPTLSSFNSLGAPVTDDSDNFIKGRGA